MPVVRFSGGVKNLIHAINVDLESRKWFLEINEVILTMGIQVIISKTDILSADLHISRITFVIFVSKFNRDFNLSPTVY